MSKILISPLGSGQFLKEEGWRREYVTANYKFEDSQIEYETSFVAAALAEHLDVDRIYFLGTVRSMWEGVYEYFAENSEGDVSVEYYTRLADKIKNSDIKESFLQENDLKHLNSVIDKYLHPGESSLKRGSKCKIITYGVNEEEIWENFDTIIGLKEEFSQGDKIYLDITHSFRSIPMLMYLLMDFVQTLQTTKIQLAGIYYGMFQAKNEYTPVVDLSPLFEISKWIRGVYDFTNYGNGYLISELVNSEEISNSLKRVSNLVNINLLQNLYNQIKNLRNLIQDSSSNNVFKYIEPQIKTFLNRFADLESEWEFQFEISKWYAENKNYVNAYICLTESILTYLCELYNFELDDYEKRKKVKSLIANSNNAKKHSHNKAFAELNSLFIKINKVRQNVAHGGITHNMRNENYDIANFKKYQSKVKNIIKKDKLENLPEMIGLKY